MVQVPTDSNIADINTKPLGGERIRLLLNLFGFWHNEEQTRVGELERWAYEEKTKFAGKVNKIAKMIVRIVALEGLRPLVTDAS